MTWKTNPAKRGGLAGDGSTGRARKSRGPEEVQQVALVACLRMCRIPFSGSMNGVMKLTEVQAARAKAAGMERGDPDLIIWAPPPGMPGKVGMAIEMKKPDLQPSTDRAGEFSGARPEQRERLEMLRSNGWHVVVAYTCADALEKMRAAGYAVPLGARGR